MLIRALLAVVGTLLAYALFGPVTRLIGFPASGDMETVFRVCVAGIAVFYIVKGSLT